MTRSIAIVDDEMSVAWDAFVAGRSSSYIYHHYAWRAFYEEYFRKQTFYFAALDDTRKICGVLPLVRQKSRLFGDYLVSLPFFNYGGILADDQGTAAELLDRAAVLGSELGVSHIELRNDGRRSELPYRSDKVSMRLALPDNDDELFSSFAAKLRSQIRRPLRENPVVEVGTHDLIDDFYEVFSRNMRDLGTPVYAKQMFVEILQRFPGSVDIVVVSISGKPASAAFLIHNNGVTEIPWASTVRAYNKIGVNMLLYWHALKVAIGRESRTFDFGRSTVDSGPYRFKKQWGAGPVQLFWEYWLRDGEDLPQLNPQNAKYSIAISAWKKLPVSLTKIIGPYLVRNLP